MQCQLIDDLLYGVMAEVQTIPHGSALSSLTTQSGDLDMVIHPRGLYKYGLTDKVSIKQSITTCLQHWTVSDFEVNQCLSLSI